MGYLGLWTRGANTDQFQGVFTWWHPSTSATPRMRWSSPNSLHANRSSPGSVQPSTRSGVAPGTDALKVYPLGGWGVTTPATWIRRAVQTGASLDAHVRHSLAKEEQVGVRHRPLVRKVI